MTTSLDVSEKLPKGLVEVYSQIHGIAAELSVPLLIVGATARDIILLTAITLLSSAVRKMWTLV